MFLKKPSWFPFKIPFFLLKLYLFIVGISECIEDNPKCHEELLMFPCAHTHMHTHNGLDFFPSFTITAEGSCNTGDQ